MTSGQCQVLSFAFYEDEHVEDNNPCVINCSKCNVSGMAGSNRKNLKIRCVCSIAKLAMGAYVKATDGESAEYSYIQDDTKGEKLGNYYFVSYDSIVSSLS